MNKIYLTIFSLIFSTAHSALANAEVETIQIRTAKVDSTLVAMTADMRLFAIDCASSQLVLPDTRGRILIEKTKESRSAVPRTPARMINNESAALLCSSPLNTEFDLIVSSKQSDKLQVVPRTTKFEEYADSSALRTFQLGDQIVGVTEGTFRLVGFNCKAGPISRFLGTASGRLVLQNNDGILHLADVSLIYKPETVNKPMTERAVETVCLNDSGQMALDLDLSGVKSAQVDVTGERTINARGK